MQKLHFIGHLGRNAELREVERADHSGFSPVVNFSVGVSVGWGDQKETQWYGCAYWGERAKKIAQWLTKGRLVYVEGEPGLRMWERRDKQGWSAELTCRVSNVEFLSRGDESPAAKTEAPEPTAAPGGVVKPAAANVDEDVPF